MPRATRPGTIQDAIARAFRASGGLECAALDCGARISTLSYGTEANEDRPGVLGVGYLDRLGRVTPASAEPLAEHFARLAKGRFVPSAPEPARRGPHDHAAALVREGAEAVEAVLDLLNDGDVAHAAMELRDVRRAVDAALADLEGAP